MLAMSRCNWGWPWQGSMCVPSCVCALVGVSTRIHRRDRPEGARGGMGAKFVCDDPTTWPTRGTSGGRLMRSMGRCGCSAGAGCMRSDRCTGSGDAASPPHRPWDTHPPRGRTPAQTDESSRAALALVVGAGAAGSGDHLAGLCGSVLHRTHVSFLQASAQVDDAQASVPRGSRSLDLAGASGVRPTPPGPSACCRSSPPLACPVACGETDPCARATGLFTTSADPGPSGVRAKTLRTLVRTTQRAKIGPSKAVSCGQIDRVSRLKPWVVRLSPASF